MFDSMRDNWWTRLRVRIAWGIRRPGMLRYLERSVNGNRDAGKTLLRGPGDRRRCLCGKHPYNVICGAELIYEAFGAGVYAVIKEPWFLTLNDPEPGEIPWTPRDSQEWLTGQAVTLPRVILGPVEGAFVGFLRDQWRYSTQTATDEGTGAFLESQRFRVNPGGTFKGNLELGERYYFGYDWNQAARCRQELTLLGFQPEDLTP